MIEKIKSTNGDYWLVEQIEISNGNLIGNAVRLSKTKGEDYYFIKNVPIISEANIDTVAVPSSNELLFFDYVKKMDEVPGRKFIVEDFGVHKYLVDPIK